jgi:hypothetical protein
MNEDVAPPTDKPLKDQISILRELNVDEQLITDVGSNPSGQYDLVAGT